jgi:hypothetical protein
MGTCHKEGFNEAQRQAKTPEILVQNWVERPFTGHGYLESHS